MTMFWLSSEILVLFIQKSRGSTKTDSHFLGTIFSTKVRLGGRLRATRRLRSTAQQSEHQQKDAFKWSMSASMGLAPFVDAKGGFEKSGSKAHGDQNISNSASDAIVWEAQGGNTLLCSKYVVTAKLYRQIEWH
jgi:hypothetical protein